VTDNQSPASERAVATLIAALPDEAPPVGWQREVLAARRSRRPLDLEHEPELEAVAVTHRTWGRAALKLGTIAALVVAMAVPATPAILLISSAVRGPVTQPPRAASLHIGGTPDAAVPALESDEVAEGKSRMAQAPAAVQDTLLVGESTYDEVMLVDEASHEEVTLRSLEARRSYGETNIVPDAAVRLAIATRGLTRIEGRYKICLASDGSVESVRVVKSSGFASYDLKITSTVRDTWRYQLPHVNGKQVAICVPLQLVYTQE
jgi:hypothetical protein